MQLNRSSKGNIAIVFLLIIAVGAVGFYWLSARHKQAVINTPVVSKTLSPKLTAEQCTAKLPFNFLVGQVLMVDTRADDLANNGPVFKRYSIGGAVVMSAPLKPDDGSINKFKKAGASLGVPIFTSTDEEGGIVQRFRILGVLSSPEAVAKTLNADQAQEIISEHGTSLKAVGIDMVLGPLADVAPAQGNSVLGSRIFSNDPAAVSQYVSAYVRGWQNAKILPTLKHFPGLGSSTGNTDFELATTPSFDQLKKRDFVPYEGNMAATGTAVMIGNQNVPGWFQGPASLSPKVNQYLRSDLGYKNNLVVTDSLRATAITKTTSLKEAVVKAISAGNDIALIVKLPNDPVSSKDMLGSIETALKLAVKDQTIPMQQLAQSVLRKLQVQHINPCSLSLSS